jgi:hypothetical protein
MAEYNGGKAAGSVDSAAFSDSTVPVPVLHWFFKRAKFDLDGGNQCFGHIIGPDPGNIYASNVLQYASPLYSCSNYTASRLLGPDTERRKRNSSCLHPKP